jgi:hypothetical protein
VNISIAIEDRRRGFRHLVDMSRQQITHFWFEGLDATTDMSFRWNDIE